MPLALIALASYLAGEHVVVVDGRFELAPEARVVELAGEAICLGVTVRTGRPLRDALRVSAAARAANPRLTVLWGGPHATHAPESCLASGVLDACARGAGERALAAAVHAALAGRSLSEIPGLAVPHGPVPEPEAPCDPQETPPASYCLVDLERHFEARGARRLDYCGSRGARETGLHALAADRLLAELGELAERHRLKEISFRDEDFFGERCRADEILSGLAERSGRLTWQAGARPDDLLQRSSDWWSLLSRSGCRKLHVRPPADVPARGEVRDRVLAAAARLHEAGVAARFELAVTEPGPKAAVLAAAVNLARTLCALDPRFETPVHRTTPLPPAEELAGEPGGLESWAARAEAPWLDLRAERRLARTTFYFAEAQRRSGRRPGQQLLRTLSLLRVRLGLFGFAVEKTVVEAVALLRTGRARPPLLAD